MVQYSTLYSILKHIVRIAVAATLVDVGVTYERCICRSSAVASAYIWCRVLCSEPYAYALRIP